MLTISERDIRRNGPGHLLRVVWRQWRMERALARRGIHFRSSDPADVERAYSAMTAEEFDAVNGQQNWANWRTIPRALSGHVPDRPLRVLDLGCGTGSSTQVLAFYCPPGSHITGYEFAPRLLELARHRQYRHRSGAEVRVDFCCQGVTEPFRESEESVDLVNASGVVGHHLSLETARRLVEEVSRVLTANGVAMLDVGPALSAAVLEELMMSAGFLYVGHYRSWFGDPTGQIVFQKKQPTATL